MESALKHRLLGAAVLIALAVIFVPMFFSNTPPKPENTTQNLNIPPAPERNFETRTLTVDPSGSPSSSATPTIPAVPARADGDKVTTVTTPAPSTFEALDTAAPTKPVIATPPTSATASIKPMTPPVTAPTPPPAPATQADGRFLVNLGVYSDAAHVTALVDKVKKLGYPAFAEATEYQGKAAQRVRVGPYADRAAAENVRLKIKQVDEKVPSSVVETAESSKPVAPTPSTAKSTAAEAPAPTLPSNRAGGYAVQVGAFKSEEEANKVRDRLRNGGVAAFVDKSGDGEQTLWKVRAGPYADRSVADTAMASIKQKFQLSGMVRTLP